MITQAEQAQTQQAEFVAQVDSALVLSKDRLAAVLPRHLSADKMIQLARTFVYRTPDLQKCDTVSIVASVVEAAELGLEIGGPLGEGCLVPRWNSKTKSLECHFQPMYRGLVKLATNTGEIRSIHAYTFYENDFFEYELGTDPKLIHRPAVSNRGSLLGVYCTGRLAGGEAFVEVMDRATIERIRQYSQTPDRGPWKDEYEEMARKSVIRRKLKTLPCSSEKLRRAIELDNQDYKFEALTAASAPDADMKPETLIEQLRQPRVKEEWKCSQQNKTAILDLCSALVAQGTSREELATDFQEFFAEQDAEFKSHDLDDGQAEAYIEHLQTFIQTDEPPLASGQPADSEEWKCQKSQRAVIEKYHNLLTEKHGMTAAELQQDLIELFSEPGVTVQSLIKKRADSYIAHLSVLVNNRSASPQ